MHYVKEAHIVITVLVNMYILYTLQGSADVYEGVENCETLGFHTPRHLMHEHISQIHNHCESFIILPRQRLCWIPTTVVKTVSLPTLNALFKIKILSILLLCLLIF